MVIVTIGKNPAPKDGTLILAVDRNGWREMWWMTNGTDYADYWQDQFDSEPEPTHWMPLPPPPEKENKGDNKNVHD